MPMTQTWTDHLGVRLPWARYSLWRADTRSLRTRTSRFNARGACVLTAKVDDATRPGVVCAPSVRWPRRSPGGRNVNALTSERLTDAGGGPTFYSCLVEVERDGD